MAIENHPADSRVTVSEDGIVQTLSSRMGTGGGNVPLVAEAKDAVCYGISAYESNAMKSSNPNSGVYEDDTSRTLDLNGGNPNCNQGGIAVVQKRKPCEAQGFDGYNGSLTGDKIVTIGANCGMSTGLGGVIALDRASFNQGENAQFDFEVNEAGTSPTMVARGPGAVCYCIGNGQADQTDLQETVGALDCMHDQKSVIHNYTVRRLTPMECERLQGFPDGWTDIGDYIDAKGKLRKTNDGARYKALGNSIAIPPWTYVLSRLNEHCAEKTMASLFDGIGGFPLIWERLNGKGSCLWASEIEDFPIAVTKKHFGEQEARDDKPVRQMQAQTELPEGLLPEEGF